MTDKTLPFSVLDLAPIPQGSSAREAFSHSLDLAQLSENWADDEPGFDLNLMYKEVFGGFSDVQSLRIPKKFKTTTVTQTSASPTSVTAQ